MSFVEFQINTISSMKHIKHLSFSDENLNFPNETPKTSEKICKSSSSHHQNIRFTSMLKSIGNDCSPDNDLTNLNWLQDGDLLKKVYATNFDQSTSLLKRNSKHVSRDGHSPNLDLSDDSIYFQQPSQNCEKPPYSYSSLIFMAIESSVTKSMMVRDIYKWIINHYPYFSTAPSGWKNTIRHTLSLRKCFKKINVADLSSKKETDVKGGHWYVDPEYRSILQQQVQRISINVFSKLLSNNNNHPLRSYKKTLLEQTNNDFKSNQSKEIIVNQFCSQPFGNKISAQSSVRSTICPVLVSHKYGKNFARTKLIKMNSKYFVLNPNSVRFDNVSGNIYRNLVSVISVNQAPKLYAPVPILSSKNISASKRRSKNFNLLKDKQNVCVNCDHLATSGFESKHDAQAAMENGIQSLKCNDYVGNSNVWKRSNSLTFTKQNKRLVNNNFPMETEFKKNNENNNLHVSNTSIKDRYGDNSDNKDDNDGMLRDGAQALLNFASRSFLFDLIN